MFSEFTKFLVPNGFEYNAHIVCITTTQYFPCYHIVTFRFPKCVFEVHFHFSDKFDQNKAGNDGDWVVYGDRCVNKLALIHVLDFSIQLLLSSILSLIYEQLSSLVLFRMVMLT